MVHIARATRGRVRQLHVHEQVPEKNVTFHLRAKTHDYTETHNAKHIYVVAPTWGTHR